MTSQERFSAVHAQLEHLQAKYVGTGHGDTTKLCVLAALLFLGRASGVQRASRTALSLTRASGATGMGAQRLGRQPAPRLPRPLRWL